MWRKFKVGVRWLTRPHLIIAAVAMAFIAIDLLLKPLTWITVTLIAVALLPWFFSYVKSLGIVGTVELPGGLKVELQKVAEKARDAGLLRNEAPEDAAEQLTSQYLQDPTLALASLRIDIERRLRRLAQLSWISDGSNRTSPTSSSPSSGSRLLTLSRLMDELQKHHVLSPMEDSALRDMMPTLDAAIHAQTVSAEAAQWVIEYGPRILAALDSKIRAIEVLENRPDEPAGDGD
ncbi:MAG TPA: hypothetical protein VMS43_04240 [Allosphingosinicella sp.]|nr:hypothetical protein [Allosphingosinicella sp.]